MTPGSSVEIGVVRQIADLANLTLTPEEEGRMQRDLNNILGHIAQLNEVDTEGIEPMSQVSAMLEHSVLSRGEELRIDEARPSVDRTLVLEQAPDSTSRFFKVPKVIER